MTAAPVAFPMRAPCAGCGCPDGRIEPRGFQDCVFCLSCGRFAYNAPRTETGREQRTVSTVHSKVKPQLRLRILTRASFRCEFCGTKDGEIDVDHVVSVKLALEDGWTDEQINSEDNLAASCKQCNAGKGTELLPLRCVIALYMRRMKARRSDA